MSKEAGNGEIKTKTAGKKSLLIDYVQKQVNVITNDGRNIVGMLLGFDQVCNLILGKSAERIFSMNEGMQVVSLGLYVIRGDNIAVIGELDADRDAKVQWDKTKGHRLKPVVH